MTLSLYRLARVRRMDVSEKSPSCVKLCVLLCYRDKVTPSRIKSKSKWSRGKEVKGKEAECVNENESRPWHQKMLGLSQVELWPFCAHISLQRQDKAIEKCFSYSSMTMACTMLLSSSSRSLPHSFAALRGRRNFSASPRSANCASLSLHILING